MSALRVLYLGVTPKVMTRVRAHFKEVEEITCADRDQFQAVMELGGAANIHIVMAGPDFADLPIAELGQGLRMAFQDVPIFFACESPRTCDRQELMKNGFMEAFMLPADDQNMAKVLARAASTAEHRVFTPVRLVDIEPGTKLDFSLRVFLPVNNRYILYSAAGDALETERLERLKEYRYSTIYVPVDQIASFYSYSARRLGELHGGRGGNLSQTQREEKLHDSVRELVTGLLGESYSKHLSEGKKVVEHTRKIVSEFIMLSNPAQWYVRLMNEIGQKRDAYSHAGTVASLAVLFSIALKIGRPEDLAIAGLFHDLGMHSLPDSLQDKREEAMRPEEKAAYQKHPAASLDIVKARRLVVPDSVLKAIAQHHERFNGSGFPEQLSYRRFSPEAQILAMADRFDYLTRTQASVSPLSPDQAFRQMEMEFIADPELIRILRHIFERQKKAAG